jgi:serine/threonine protein phosphatase PrpC
VAELRWGSATHEGQLRSQNEDHAHAGDGLFVVADGMGGHLAGEVASEMAVTRLRERLSGDDESNLDRLVAAINEANTEIYHGSMDDPDRAGMGTTVTAIAVVGDAHDGEAMGIANVGDSRIYVVRHGRLRQLTIDHSFVQELVAEGAISRDEARTHPRRNIVTRALGIEPAVRVDSWSMPLIRGDRFVLCSDGLVDEVTDDEITKVLEGHPDDPDAAAQALVDAANAAGGRDNITVVVVDVLEGDDPPDPTEEFDVVPLWSDDDLENTGETQIIADPPYDGDTDLAIAMADETATTGGIPTLPPPTATTVGPATGGIPTGMPARRRRSRLGQLGRFILALGVAAVLVLGFAILAAWARHGYYVDFDREDQVVIYQGRDFLWFHPTAEAPGPYGRDELDEQSVALVELRLQFASQASAAQFVASRLTPTTTTTTTTVPGAVSNTSTSSTTEPTSTTGG